MSQQQQAIIMNVYEGFCRNLNDGVAILKTAQLMNLTHDQVKEAVYG